MVHKYNRRNWVKIRCSSIIWNGNDKKSKSHRQFYQWKFRAAVYYDIFFIKYTCILLPIVKILPTSAFCRETDVSFAIKLTDDALKLVKTLLCGKMHVDLIIICQFSYSFEYFTNRIFTQKININIIYLWWEYNHFWAYIES